MAYSRIRFEIQNSATMTLVHVSEPTFPMNRLLVEGLIGGNGGGGEAAAKRTARLKKKSIREFDHDGQKADAFFGAALRQIYPLNQSSRPDVATTPSGLFARTL